MAQTWNDSTLPWQTWDGTNHPWKNPAMPWNNSDLPWKDGSQPSWAIPGSSIDLDFFNGRYYGGTLASCLSLSRGSSAITADSVGTLYDFATGEFRIRDLGIKTDPARTNKCTNYNANPTDLTGVTKSGDAAATLTVVDDTAALLAAGLQNICTSGKVYKLDNSAGVASSIVTFSGAPGNTNAHFVSVYMRGSGSAKPQTAGVSSGAMVTLTGSYVRTSRAVTPAGTGDLSVLFVNAGATVYFILNQLEEGAFVTSSIVVAGSSATRQADNISLIGPASTIALNPTGWAVVEFGTGAYEASAYLIGGAGASDYYIRQGSGGATTIQGRFGGATNTAATIGASGSIGAGVIKAGVSWNATAFNLAGNNGTVATLAQAPVLPAGVYLAGRNGSNVSSLHFRRLTMGYGDIGAGIGAKTA